LKIMATDRTEPDRPPQLSGSPPHIAVDTARWPFVVVSFEDRYTNDDFESYLRRLKELLGRGMAGLLVDTRVGPPPNPLQRQRLRSFVSENRPALRHLYGAAFVVDSDLARGALRAMAWMMPKPCPVTAVATPDQGIAWLEAKHSPRHA
jgi:hypothetical protein